MLGNLLGGGSSQDPFVSKIYRKILAGLPALSGFPTNKACGADAMPDTPFRFYKSLKKATQDPFRFYKVRVIIPRLRAWIRHYHTLSHSERSARMVLLSKTG